MGKYVIKSNKTNLILFYRPPARAIFPQKTKFTFWKKLLLSFHYRTMRVDPHLRLNVITMADLWRNISSLIPTIWRWKVIKSFILYSYFWCLRKQCIYVLVFYHLPWKIRIETSLEELFLPRDISRRMTIASTKKSACYIRMLPAMFQVWFTSVHGLMFQYSRQ